MPSFPTVIRHATEVTVKPLAKPILARRVDVPASQLGFSPPPCAIHIKFFPLGTGWTLVALTPPAKPPAAARWLEPYGPVSIHIAPGLSPKVLRATFDKVPAAWEKFLGAVIVHYLELTPDGSASLFIEDSPEKVDKFFAGIRAADANARSRQTHAGPHRVRLTARQLEILSLAVALGYYEVPHKLNLRTLASKVGLSVGAVSELLRRGEALIVSSYVDALSEAEWQASQQSPPVVQTVEESDRRF